VQGVGFRPFVFRLALKHRLVGFVKNSGSQVLVEVQGSASALAGFDSELREAKPEGISYSESSKQQLMLEDDVNFSLRESDTQHTVFEIPPDLSTCHICLEEMRNPKNRRYQYPFVHCSSCGPRWSILAALPFDRERTTLRDFPLCAACMKEYLDPNDRRFHAQTISCSECGPRVALMPRRGQSSGLQGDSLGSQAYFRDILQEAVYRLRNGQIAAVKGVGGYQLWALASHEQAVRNLRIRKNRPQKPFAVMVLSLEMARSLCALNQWEKEALLSSESPIVLLQRHTATSIWVGEDVAPGNPDLGLMLPSSPLQTLLLEVLGVPVVATSGNVSDEPIAYEDEDALQRLSGIVDFFIAHNRRILRPLDDSVVRVIRGKTQVLRLARGLAPLCLSMGARWGDERGGQIALGADLKSAVAIRKYGKLLLSETHGNLSSREAFNSFTKSQADLKALLGLSTQITSCRDLHPGYFSAQSAPAGATQVQHHLAHALACVFEHDLSFPVSAAVWDGTGLGSDGTLWGGEFLKISGPNTWQRAGHLLPFPLLGGEAAIRDPRRAAFALLWQAGCTSDAKSFGYTEDEIYNWSRMAQNARMAPLSSGMGRLFDGVSALIDCCEGSYKPAQYEGQAAMKLEYRARKAKLQMDFKRQGFSLDILAGKNCESGWVWDWRKLLEKIVLDLKAGESPDQIAWSFHASLIQTLGEFFQKEMDSGTGEPPTVVLAGGCFQNRILLEGACEELERRKFKVFWSEKIPIHDGGIAVGQLVFGSALKGRT
jgi:hydrogenase maturation protein HypF